MSSARRLWWFNCHSQNTLSASLATDGCFSDEAALEKQQIKRNPKQNCAPASSIYATKQNTLAFAGERELRFLKFAGPLIPCVPSMLDNSKFALETWHVQDDDNDVWKLHGYGAREAEMRRLDSQRRFENLRKSSSFNVILDVGLERPKVTLQQQQQQQTKSTAGSDRLRAYLQGDSNLSPVDFLRGNTLSTAAPFPKRLELLRRELAVDDAAVRKSALPVYVENWLREPWIEAIATDPQMAHMFNHKRLKKEMTESWGVYEMLKREFKRYPPPSRAKLLLFDVCSGRGFLSILLSHKYPEATVYMIDNDKTMDVSHVKSLPNVRVMHMDILCDDGLPFREWLLDETRVWRMNLDDTSSSSPSGVRPVYGIMLGIHLCGMLSERFIRAFNVGAQNDMTHFAVLSPCCIPQGGRHEGGVSHRARALGVDPFGLWTKDLLAMFGKTESGEDIRISMSVENDSHVMSTKNTVILCHQLPLLEANKLTTHA